MPKKWFVCPDGESIEIKDCMEKCRLASRCAPIPFLKMAGEWRPWRGHASVTMLERCLRMRWLQERVDFSETPDGSAFRIIGTRGHAALEDYGQGQLATEQYMELDGLRGVTDLVEEDNGTRTLWDYKVVGSFSVAKMLGICEVGTKDILDDDGNPVILSRGKNAGSVKTEKVYGIDPRKADISDYQLQPNVYKLAWEALHPDLQIDALKIFAIVRDGGLYLSKGRGVLRNTYVVDIPIMPEAEVRDFAMRRKVEIEEGMAQDVMPPVGSAKECWDGRFCQSYCPVREACKAAGDNPYLGGFAEVYE